MSKIPKASRRKDTAKGSAGRKILSHDLFRMHLGELGLDFITEHPVTPERKWRYDFYLPDRAIAIEIEGGVYTRGRHVRPAGFIGDCEKYNTAAMLGVKVLRFPTDQIISGEAKRWIAKHINDGLSGAARAWYGHCSK